MAPTSRDIAKAAANKKKPKKEDPKPTPWPKENPPNTGRDNEWFQSPFYRGDPRPPRIDSKKRDATGTRDSAGNSRQFFNPKAKLDSSQVRDRRITNPDRTIIPPGADLTRPPPGRWAGTGSGFKWNPNMRKGPPPKSRVDTDDITSTMAPSRTAMQNLIDLANRKRSYTEFRLQGTEGLGL